MKLSDVLRNAADRAPIERMSVSTADAAGRVKRERALRMGGNGLVGAGAVAVIAMGAIGPLGADMQDAALSVAPAMEGSDGAPALGTMEDSGGAAGFARPAEQWMCGTNFDAADGAWSWGDGSGVTFTVGEPERDGDEIQLPHTLQAHRPVDLLSGPDYVVTWEGIVVGRMMQPSPLQYGPADEPMLPDGAVYERLEPGTDTETLEQVTVLTPVNCWDGAPLPAADYEVHHAWTLAYGAEMGEPSEPAEPTEPTEPPNPDNGAASEAEVLPAPAIAETFRVTADPVSLTIDGEAVDEPFADHLGGDTPVDPAPAPPELEPLPDGYLTPELARELYEANLVNGSWDMAAGTQRWLKMSDSASGDDDWMRNFYGCSWDGNSGASFPTASAAMSLLDVRVDLPARIGVSYGFVVDGNPMVTSKLSNASEYTIPGYWTAQPQLFLVQDGRVVAEGFPVSIDQQGMGLARGAVEGDMTSELSIAPVDNGALAPGQSVDGRYLWRDVNGCYNEAGPGTVSPGTYTVLSLHSLSLSDAYSPLYYGVEPLIERQQSLVDGQAMGGDLLTGESPSKSLDLGRTGLGGLDMGSAGVPEPAVVDGAEPDVSIYPMPSQTDWLELQGWTSLGTITVS